MRRHRISCAWIVGLMLAGSVGAHAADGHQHRLQCAYGSDYDVQVQPNGIAFMRSEGHPSKVFMHNGQLRMDGRDVAVSADDAVRLRAYEQQVRELVPAMADIARDGVDIGYAALSSVVATLADNSDDRTRMLQTLHDRRDEAMHEVDSTLGRGLWSAGDDGRLFGEDLGRTVANLVGSLAGDAVSDALSGDSSRMASLQARANALDTTLSKAVQEPAEKLGQRAEALCPRLSALDQLQQQFRFRLADGERLQLLSLDMDSSNKASQYAQR
jgi:predicted trehalose synthase